MHLNTHTKDITEVYLGIRDPAYLSVSNKNYYLLLPIEDDVPAVHGRHAKLPGATENDPARHCAQPV